MLHLTSSVLLLIIFFVFGIISKTVTSFPLTGSWSVPELTPPPRSQAVMQCFPTYETDPFTGFTTFATRLQLFGGLIEGDATVQTTFSWYPDQFQWYPQENQLPSARAGFTVVYDTVTGIYGNQAQTAYLWGGTSVGDNTLADSYVYKSQFGAPWTKTVLRKATKRDAPSLTRFASWVGFMQNTVNTPETNGALFVWGGLGSGGVSNSLYWFAFDDTTVDGLRWAEAYKIVPGGPTARYDHCCAAMGNSATSAICFGGAGLEEDYNDVWIVDWSGCDQSAIDNSPWTACATWNLAHTGNLTQAAIDGNDFPPTPRRGATCAYIETENVLVVVGGYDVNSGTAITDTTLYRYNVATQKWAKNPQVINQTDLLVNPSSAYNSISESDLITPRYGASMAPCVDESTGNTTLYLFGGIDGSGKPTGDTFQLGLGVNTLPFPDHDPSLLLLKRVDSSAASRPIGRAEHAAVASAGQLIIMFGRSGLSLSSALGDVWSYNVSTKVWTEIQLVYDEKNLLKSEIPRTGATAIEFRGVIIFGGQDITGAATNDLLQLSPLTGEIRKVTFSAANTDVPKARAYHVMVRLGDFVVIGTGWSEEAGYMGDDDWWRYNPVDQSWKKLTLSGDAIGSRLAMAALERYNETHSVVGGGIGSRVFSDYFFISLDAETHSILIVSKIVLDITGMPWGERDVIRAYGSIAGVGNHLFVCNGAISETDPAPDPNCYQLDLADRMISPIASPFLPAVYATATMIGDEIIFFGGVETTATSFTNKFLDTPQILRVSPTCAENAKNDSSCIKCSKGFKNVGTADPDCRPASPGSYIVDGLKNFELCRPGTYSRSFAASSESACLPCPTGFYQPNAGATNCTPCDAGHICLAGASSQITASSQQGKALAATLSKSGLLFQSNPKPYGSLDIPWMPILIISLTAIILTALVTAVLIVTSIVYAKRRDYYVPLETRQQLELIYLAHAKAIRGMSEKEFIQAAFSSDFPQHDASILTIQRLFQELNVNGIGALDMGEFIEAFVILISRGHMKPVPGSQRSESDKEFDHWAAPLIGSWDVRKFDSFADNHMTATIGQNIRTQQISYGGAVTLFFYVAAIILTLAIIINFFYNNTTESKGSVIHSVIQSSFGSQFVVQSDFVVSVTVLGPVRSLTNISTLEDACVANAATQTCRSTASVTPTNVITASSNSIGPLTCSYDARTGCTLTWTCTGCRVTEGSTGSLLFRFAPQIAASTIDVSTAVTTGIRDPVMSSTGRVSMVAGPNQQSTVITRTAPTIATEVLTGFPASVVSLGLTPTYYEADEVDSAVNANAEKARFTGYHVRQVDAPRQGNSVPTELFSQYFDAPLLLQLTTDEVPLLIQRKFTQDVVQLVTSLLGAIAGVSGGLLAAVQFLDSKIGINENCDELRHDKIEDADEVAGLTDTYHESNVKMLMTAEEFKVLRPVIEKGVEPQMALAFLEVLRRRRATGGKGNGLRIAGRQQSLLKKAVAATAVMEVTNEEIHHHEQQRDALFTPRDNIIDNNNNNNDVEMKDLSP